MPAFVRSKQDEARWSKAKSAASKSKKKDEGSFTDQDWALVNHIYHQMGKSDEFAKSVDDPLFVEAMAIALEKAKKLSDEYDPNDMGDDGSEEDLGEGFREFDPEEEASAGEDWLKENDPTYGRGGDYEEYDDNEDEDAHQRAIDEDLGDVEQAGQETGEEGGASQGSPVQAQATVQPEDSEEEVAGRQGRFKQPTREELTAIRSYTRPWEQRARDAARIAADPIRNPVLAHYGGLVEAREQHYGDRRRAYQDFVNSDEYKNADPITQMEMDDKFESDWKAKNPNSMNTAMQVHDLAHKKDREYGGRVGAKGTGIYDAAKDAQIKNILSGGTHSPDAVSLEEGLQHAGGVKGEEGTEGSIKHDPASSFAMGNQDFIRQYAKDYAKKGKKPGNIDEMMPYDEEAKKDIDRILGPGPSKDPRFEQFFAHYYPLIGMSANRTIKRLGLDPKNPDVDMSMLHEAGMHGLIQAMNDYDHDNPSKASFVTHAGNKIRGLQMTAMKNQDQIPAEIRQAQKKFEAQPAKPKSQDLIAHPSYSKGTDVADRMKRVGAQRQAQAIRRTGAAAQPKKIAAPIQMPSEDDGEEQ
jgi:hypothetical protein